METPHYIIPMQCPTKMIILITLSSEFLHKKEKNNIPLSVINSDSLLAFSLSLINLNFNYFVITTR